MHTDSEPEWPVGVIKHITPIGVIKIKARLVFLLQSCIVFTLELENLLEFCPQKVFSDGGKVIGSPNLLLSQVPLLKCL